MVLVGRLVRPLSRCQDFNEGHRRSHLPCVQTDEDLRRVTGSGSASRFFQVSDQTWEWGGGGPYSRLHGEFSCSPLNAAAPRQTHEPHKWQLMAAGTRGTC